MQNASQAVELLIAVSLIVIGLSHIIAHKAWGEFFEKLVALGRPGAFANGFLTLVPGTIVVGFHQIWSGIPVIVTLLGWAWVIKGTLIFLYPDRGVRSMQRVNQNNSRLFIVPGIIMLIVAGLILFHLFQTSHSTDEQRPVPVQSFGVEQLLPTAAEFSNQLV